MKSYFSAFLLIIFLQFGVSMSRADSALLIEDGFYRDVNTSSDCFSVVNDWPKERVYLIASMTNGTFSCKTSWARGTYTAVSSISGFSFYKKTNLIWNIDQQDIDGCLKDFASSSICKLIFNSSGLLLASVGDVAYEAYVFNVLSTKAFKIITDAQILMRKDQIVNLLSNDRDDFIFVKSKNFNRLNLVQP